MSVFSNPQKVLHNVWERVTSAFATRIYPYLKTVEADAVAKGEEVLVEVGKAVLAQAQTQLGSDAKVGDVIKAAVELGIPMLESKGVAAATALLYNVVSALLIAVETHEAAQ
ncbi:MAG: hypothetical protein U0835_00050 [Isosphaeraceae bacterium]